MPHQFQNLMAFLSQSCSPNTTLHSPTLFHARPYLLHFPVLHLSVYLKLPVISIFFLDYFHAPYQLILTNNILDLGVFSLSKILLSVNPHTVLFFLPIQHLHILNSLLSRRASYNPIYFF